MNRTLSRIACAIVAAALPIAALAQSAASSEARVIVKLKPSSRILAQADASTHAGRAERAQALGQRAGVALAAGPAISDSVQVVTATGMSADELALRLAAQSDVAYAVPDGRVRRHAAPNDPLYLTGGVNGPAAGQWYLRAPSGSLLAAIDAESAWATTTGDPSIVVAVIDTGVRFDHPDLAPVAAGGNLLAGYDFISDVPTANDGDGRDADPSDPGDWVTAAEANDPLGPFYQCTERDATGQYTAQDSSWHGTQVSGIVGAMTNNGSGMASVGRGVRLLPLRAVGKCGGSDSDVIAAMRWAAGIPVPGTPRNATPARVINLSLGGESPCGFAYQDAVNDVLAAGAVIVASAGNTDGHAVDRPANCAGAIGVGGLRHVGTKVGFSALGPEVSVSAPAGNCGTGAASDPCQYPILTTTNSGVMAAASSSYSDAYDTSLGTSFASPLVAGTAALMLSARPSLSPAQVKTLLESTARLFPTTAADAPGTPQPTCTPPRYDFGGNPIDQLQCACTQNTCGAGMLDAGAAVRAAVTGFPPTGLSAQGLWWNAPGESESGWGINFAHQGDVIFATWYTYDATGRAWWLTMAASQVAENVYSGAVVSTTGPAFSASPWNPSLVARTTVGTGTLSFVNADFATFAYTVNGVSQTKRITRQAFGTLPTCTFGTMPDLAFATNHQDLWWNAPAGSESGWGLSLTEQSGIIFAAWYTYDVDGRPLWLSGTLRSSGGSTWTGQLVRTSGPSFSTFPFQPSAVVRTVVGSATLSFADGNAGTFAYTVNGVSQSKPVTRQVFRAPGTSCR